jgi:hypothetical protein
MSIPLTIKINKLSSKSLNIKRVNDLANFLDELLDL